MKNTNLWLLFAPIFLAQIEVDAQSQRINHKKNDGNSHEVLNARMAVNISFAQYQLQITNLMQDEIDKILVFNMQGSIALQQVVRSPTVILDITGLNDGVYLLVLRSSVNLKEKTVKFVVRK